MKVTSEVILDLIPLYLSGDASKDTIKLVESYFESDPDFERQVKDNSGVLFPNNISSPQKKEIEVKSLIKTKKMIKLRSYLLGFAIFFSLVPFSFLSTDEKTYWLLLEAPKSAMIYAVLGVFFWLVYYVTRKRLQVTGL
jgi:hypothetical protein